MIFEFVCVLSVIAIVLSFLHCFIKDGFVATLINMFALFFSIVAAWSWWYPTYITDSGSVIVLEDERVYAMVFYAFIVFNTFTLLVRLFGVGIRGLTIRR